MGKIALYLDDDGGPIIDDVIARLTELGASYIEQDGNIIKAKCANSNSVTKTIISEFGVCMRLTKPW